MRRINRVLVASALSLSAVGALATPSVQASNRSGTTTPATTPATAPAAAPTATYVVKRGDNLVGIAGKLKVKLADLLAVNSITLDSVIHPGDTLLVPGAGAPVAAAAPTPSATASGAVSPGTYVVKRGDALSAIASKHGVKLGPLLKANNLKIDSIVHPGATLIIPAGGTLVVSPDPAAPGPATAPSAESTSSGVEAAIAYATAQLGKPWKFNTAGPDSFDCSGLTSAAYAEIGVWLPHQSAMQSTRGTAVDWRTEPIRAGDLVFMFTSAHPDVISHVGIAIDAKRWIHAPRSGDVVRLGMIPSADKIQAVRRFVDA